MVSCGKKFTTTTVCGKLFNKKQKTKKPQQKQLVRLFFLVLSCRVESAARELLGQLRSQVRF
ncbi:hypothetical protein DMW38_04635 [Vibrio parahaemolyticus]|nr:hypothetical protein [Vibrio parahaemolyticus]